MAPLSNIENLIQKIRAILVRWRLKLLQFFPFYRTFVYLYIFMPWRFVAFALLRHKLLNNKTFTRLRDIALS